MELPSAQTPFVSLVSLPQLNSRNRFFKKKKNVLTGDISAKGHTCQKNTGKEQVPSIPHASQAQAGFSFLYFPPEPCLWRMLTRLIVLPCKSLCQWSLDLATIETVATLTAVSNLVALCAQLTTASRGPAFPALYSEEPTWRSVGTCLVCLCVVTSGLRSMLDLWVHSWMPCRFLSLACGLQLTAPAFVSSSHCNKRTIN